MVVTRFSSAEHRQFLVGTKGTKGLSVSQHNGTRTALEAFA